jgi:prohibitin 1
VAQFDAEELITQREIVSEKIASTLEKRAKDFNISVDDVSITQLQFGRAFTAAVEQKQVAEQLAEQARYVRACL